MNDMWGKFIAAAAVVLAIIYDWPRAIAGLLAGFGVRRLGFSYPTAALVVAVIAIAGLGELIYPLIGRTSAASWPSFTLGLISAGATAYGLFRWLYSVLQS